MAGLPSHVSSLLSNPSVSFLRRAAQHQLGRIANADVAYAFRATIEEAGKRIESDALDAAVTAIDGFAYMMQLVGFRAWNVADKSDTITLNHVQEGVELANSDFVSGVVKKTCDELSDGDLAFLTAMLPDGNAPSIISSIAERMGKDSSYARVCRKRLEGQGVIVALRRGYVSFLMPYLRDYLENKLW